MHSKLVSDWFGADFVKLHPLLQQLHKQGGQLAGKVEIARPAGLAGALGKALAGKLGIPTQTGEHDLLVTISHQPDGLCWDRCFNHQSTMHSTFVPTGQLPDGYWLESSGPVQLYLTVDTDQGGWHWRCLKMKVHGLRLPLWLMPKTTAYKTIEGDKYRFYVGFSLPLLGTLLSYSGLLTARIAD